MSAYFHKLTCSTFRMNKALASHLPKLYSKNNLVHADELINLLDSPYFPPVGIVGSTETARGGREEEAAPFSGAEPQDRRGPVVSGVNGL